MVLLLSRQQTTALVNVVQCGGYIHLRMKLDTVVWQDRYLEYRRLTANLKHNIELTRV